MCVNKVNTFHQELINDNPKVFPKKFESILSLAIVLTKYIIMFKIFTLQIPKEFCIFYF